MPTQRQKLVAHHVIGLEKSISATAKQIGASPTSVRGSLISYCIKMMPSLEPELTAWVEHKDRGRHRLAVIRAHKDQLMPSVDQPARRKPMSEEQQAVETAAENCEVLRARLAKYEDADGNPKAQPSGVVLPERWSVPRPIWKDARQPYGDPLNKSDIEAAGKFNLALDEVARLNQPASAGDPCMCGGNPHTTQCLYEHFLSYSGLSDQPILRYAYFHGADDHCEKPASAGDERAAFEARGNAEGENLERDVHDQYVNPYVQSAWEGWEARTAISANHSEQVRVVLPKPLKRGDAEAERGEYGGAMVRGYSAYERQLIRLNPGIAFAAAPSAGSQGGDV